MASGKAAYDVADGPVLTLINKRIRNLRKKLKRIAQLEDSIAQGKSVIKNKEQEQFLKSKPSIIAAVDDLEKLRQPLILKIHEEITLALKDKEQREMERSDEIVEDLLSLIYFGNLFNDFKSIQDRTMHERNRCMLYDWFTYGENHSVFVSFKDLDMLALMASLLTMRPEGSRVTHEQALQSCINHAKNWIRNSDNQIVPSTDYTYANLKEKLTKILNLDYVQNDPNADDDAIYAKKYEGLVSENEEQEDDVTYDHIIKSDGDKSDTTTTTTTTYTETDEDESPFYRVVFGIIN